MTVDWMSMMRFLSSDGYDDDASAAANDADSVASTTSMMTTNTTTTAEIGLGQQIMFALLSCSFFLLAYKTFRVVWSRSEFTNASTSAVAAAAHHVMILPAISVLLGLECFLFFLNSVVQLDNNDGGDGDDGNSSTDVRRRPIAATLFVLEALVPPGLFLSTFAITFFAYRIRGVPFCFVRRNATTTASAEKGTTGIIQLQPQTRESLSKRGGSDNADDESKDVENSLNYQNADTAASTTNDCYDDEHVNVERSSPRAAAAARDEMLVHEPIVQPRVLVLGMRVFALVLATTSVLINLDVLFVSSSTFTGRTGWSSVFTAGRTDNDDDFGAAVDVVHVVLSLLPMALTCIFCTYFAILLWRYGNELAMMIYASSCTPWITPILGVSAMIAGQMFGPTLFPLMSNLGIFLYLLTILSVLLEIKKDMENAVDDLGGFLSALWGGTSMDTNASLA
mmetsp:Transcript_6618/g.16712  ORF Transcript_6618/g.16712 Transcript_6618/m.16712 type:complete len:452 (+) Transcript_6618:81-1436(+)